MMQPSGRGFTDRARREDAMRLFRFLLLSFVVGMVGWLVIRSVSVESTRDAVQITFDKQKLKQAGRDLTQQGRKAADKVGEALEQAGRKLDDGRAEASGRD
jgi:enamine deaminase RidA (YjgF/YER057c/UK114 family)